MSTSGDRLPVFLEQRFPFINQVFLDVGTSGTQRFTPRASRLGCAAIAFAEELFHLLPSDYLVESDPSEVGSVIQ